MKQSLFIILMGVGIFTAEVKAEERLHCDHANYEEYIYDSEKTKRLVEQTGKGCQLSGADLDMADLRGANLEGADLSWTSFKGADLNEANLRGASLFMADLRGVNLFMADLRGADLNEANLRGASLFKADLRGADLNEANLFMADLRGADLNEANLSKAYLAKAYLARANLNGANLRGANFFKANLFQATYDDQTVFPFFFSRRGKGLIKINSEDPCALGELTFWESSIGIKAGSLFKAKRCNSSTAISDSMGNSRIEKAGEENNEQNLDERDGEVLR